MGGDDYVPIPQMTSKQKYEEYMNYSIGSIAL